METHKSMKVLYLSEWYPNIYDTSSGRFVRGHAQSAVRQGDDVCVLFFYKAPKQDKPQLFEQETYGIKEVYVYYHGSFITALRRGWQYVQQNWGKPDVCQLNVISKNALLALWLKAKYNIPYIIVEHWTGYYPESGAYKGMLHKCMARLAVHYAKIILTVSTELKQNMCRCGLQHNDYRLIRNVVYDIFFQPQPRKDDHIKRMLHVSFFDDAHKNVSDIVRAIAILAKQRQDFECVMIGKGRDHQKVMHLAEELAIPKQLIHWEGELEPDEVCQTFYQSDFFVFYSNYETAGIVLSESLICGKPVISTPVGIAPDVITPETGILVPKRNPSELAKAMNHMLDHYTDYEPEYLRKVGQAYSLDNVGKFLHGIYKEVCS